MPKSLEIAEFVLGAVMLLLALVSGGFKIFGAEVSGTAGKLGRATAFILGLYFIGLSLGVQPQPVPPSTDGLSPAQIATSPTNLAGTWEDSDGATVQIWRTGNGFFGFST
jgi:hypothetical protein